jgi:hypothetical protein
MDPSKHHLSRETTLIVNNHVVNLMIDVINDHDREVLQSETNEEVFHVGLTSEEVVRMKQKDVVNKEDSSKNKKNIINFAEGAKNKKKSITNINVDTVEHMLLPPRRTMNMVHPPRRTMNMVHPPRRTMNMVHPTDRWCNQTKTSGS